MGGGQRSATWQERFASLKDLLPVLFIFAVVIGSIYAGWATPTESAALGVIASVVLALRYKAVNGGFIKEVMEGTMRTTAMIMLILISANYLNFVLDAVGMAEMLKQFVTHLGLSPMKTLLVIIAMYVVLGLFVETLSLMVITVPIVTPVIISSGFDPVWFGILLILLIEMALITPPVGLNLYVVQGVRQQGNISEVMVGSLPFVIGIFIMIGVLVVYPDLALVLAKMV
jgi:tripartite ATP-independent transporter DctM subunit